MHKSLPKLKLLLKYVLCINVVQRKYTILNTTY